jgi:hypothetical protein
MAIAKPRMMEAGRFYSEMGIGETQNQGKGCPCRRAKPEKFVGAGPYEQAMTGKHANLHLSPVRTLGRPAMLLTSHMLDAPR